MRRRAHGSVSRLWRVPWRVVAIVSSLLVGHLVLSGGVASAAGWSTLADWSMDEPSGATVMADSSANGIDGTIGSGVLTGRVEGETTYYRWPHRPPNQPPADPERLIQVSDGRLNPGTDDYAITVRFRTPHSFGNILQKGQAGSPTGYFKLEIPNGNLRCVFRGLDAGGNLVRASVGSGSVALNDGLWHTARCERSGTTMILVVDGSVLGRRSVPLLSVSNSRPFTIGGKLNCDQITVTCDYFSGDIDSVRIEVGGGDPPPTSGVVLFQDGFDDGFLHWARVTRMTLDNSQGSPQPPSARLNVVDAPAWAEALLVSVTDQLCASVDVSVTEPAAATLLRLQTDGGKSIVRVRLDAGGYLRVRSDVSGISSPRTAPLGTGWHTVQLCGSIGVQGAWTLLRDGVPLLEGWVADTGSSPAARVQIGDSAAKTWAANFDRVVVEDVA